MADEFTVRSSLQLKNGDQTHATQPSSFVADQSNPGGPSPGAFKVSISGTDLDLSKLTVPGLARFQNLDTTNYVTLGVYEPTTDFYYPILELLPGESYVVRLHRFINRETTGTGTLVGYDSVIQLRANTATVLVLAEVFEK